MVVAVTVVVVVAVVNNADTLSLIFQDINSVIYVKCDQ